MKPGAGGSTRDYIRPLDRINTRTIDRTGGTVAPHLAHEPPQDEGRHACPPTSARRGAALEVGEDLYDFTPVVLDNIEHLGLDYLVPIGGDDTLSFSEVLADRGVLIAVPKTMDNDVQGTEYCIGFSTAITRAKEPSTASGRRSARTSGSASSASSAATPASPRSTPPT